jgi:hypothetical protein
MYFCPSLEEGLRELQRVLTPGGRAVIAVRMRQASAGRFDPSCCGMTEQDLGTAVASLHALGFSDVTANRQADLDRQPMAAIVARK